jgi:type I restriction enzyme S subunit
MFFVSQRCDDLVVSTGFAVLRPNTQLVAPRFLYACVFNEAFTEYLVAREKGAAYPAVSPEDIANAELPLPPLPEQQAIACILGSLDDKIELNRRMNRTLEEMARAIFKSWFIDFDPVRAKAQVRREHPKWTDDQVSRAACPKLKPEIARLFPDSFEDSELGEIPKGWRIGRLGDIAEHPRRGVQPDKIPANMPYIALEHMPRRCIALSEWGLANGVESNKLKFRQGEILFGKLRPYFHKVGVAPVDGVCSTDIAVVAPKSAVWFGFVLGHVSSVEFVEYTNAGSTGTKMPRTSWTEMARYTIALPPEAFARVLTERLQPVVDRIIAGIHESRTLAALRDALLPKLISGELRVPDAERIAARCT